MVGAFVRYSLGMDQRTGMVRYSVCQITGAFPRLRLSDFRTRADAATWSGVEGGQKPYRFEGVQTDIWLRLKHGKAERLFGMEAVSNSPIDSVSPLPGTLRRSFA